MKYIAGIDIGGTKCAVSIGGISNDGVTVVEKIKMPTPKEPQEAIDNMTAALKELLKKHPQIALDAVGISCGSPLNSETGVIMAPPNLPHWDNIHVVQAFEKEFAVPAFLQNDANACALAEWMWGAGKGCRNMIFLTFGTGMGAGLILGGRLYTGTNDMAGEAGHIRLEKDGPIGYHKAGSFEGFCSGGGIARLGISMVEDWIALGNTTEILKIQPLVSKITAQDIGTAAACGDALAISIYKTVGEYLGKGLSVLIDLLNPERIVIGSIFLRQEGLLRDAMEAVIEEEALMWNRKACRIVPAGLGEMTGEYAAFSIGMNGLLSGGKNDDESCQI